MFLEITAEGWVAIIGAIGATTTVIGAAVVGIIMAWQNGKKLDAAAQRREEIASKE